MKKNKLKISFFVVILTLGIFVSALDGLNVLLPAGNNNEQESQGSNEIELTDMPVIDEEPVQESPDSDETEFPEEPAINGDLVQVSPNSDETELLGVPLTGYAPAISGVPPYLSVNASLNTTMPIYRENTKSPDSAQVTLSITAAGDPVVGRLPVDIVFALDCSGSMSSNDPSYIRRNASKNLVDELNLTQDQAGVVNWDDYIHQRLDLTNNATKIKQEIDKNVYDWYGMTNITRALFESISVLDGDTRPGIARAIIFLTDGYPTVTNGYIYSTQPGSPVTLAKSRGYVIYAIGLGSVNPTIMKDMANTTGGQYFKAQNASSLIPIFDQIANTLSTIAGTDVVATAELADDIIYVTGSSSIPPFSIINNRTLIWNVGTLSINDTWSVTFDIKASVCGYLPVTVFGLSNVTYTRYNLTQDVLPFPPLFVRVIGDPKDLKADAIALLNTLECWDDHCGDHHDHCGDHHDQCGGHHDNCGHLTREIICKIECSLNEKLWLNSTHLSPKWGYKVFDYEACAVVLMEGAIHHYTCQIPRFECAIAKLEVKGCNATKLKAELACIREAIAVYKAVILILVEADELLAEAAVADAESIVVQCPKFQAKVDHLLCKANKDMNAATGHVANGQYLQAILHYKSAWEHAQCAIKFANKKCHHCHEDPIPPPPM